MNRSIKKLFSALIIVNVILFSSPVSANTISDAFGSLKKNIITAYNNDDWYLYMPLYAWHNRLFYNDEHISRYNEKAFGVGIGKGFWDGNEWHGIVAMGFADSNDELETFFGYIYQYNWDIDKEGHCKVGLGYTLGVTQREDWKYFPVPVPLPVVSLTYKKLSLQATYIPGVQNNGNVLFVMATYLFD